MDSEIELKLLVSADAESKIRKQFLPDLNADIEHQSIQLFNSYYDTPEQILRQHGMGLRVRGNNGEYEQTIKCRDGSVGGLHKRAEYNVSLPSNQLDIALFPGEVWPANINTEDLKFRLSSLFSTHFRREQYLIISDQDTQVEMVFDSGEIETDKYHSPVCEVELELKKGAPEAIFQLARKLLEAVPFRLGYKSKAQRGYELYVGEDLEVLAKKPEFPIAKHTSLQDAFITLMSVLVEFWQRHEQRFVEHGKVRDIVELVAIMRLMKRNLKLFEKQLSCPEFASLSKQLKVQLREWQWVDELSDIKELLSKKGFYRKKLQKHDAVLQHLQARQVALLKAHEPLKLLQQKGYISLQLDILEMLTHKPWTSDPSWQEESINRFAKIAIRDELKSIFELFQFKSKESVDAYLKHIPALQRVVHIQKLLGNAVGSRTGQSLETWTDLLDGAEELKVLHTLEGNLRQLSTEGDDNLVQWCVAKQDGLFEVMELSREAALVAQSE
ncbi:CYTH domain-containing protein [Planctobacterium marinum]|uniref:CYTH domain-containing protein n=1 Tax=Planctobacterium marinum TaxID=1631968 RepID=UPI001E529B74|nr:CYTH domain-containing protein [Planctobacterium marinum]MCC2605279.1 CYTH domain-containing protein [Planctobacterium marinum]